MLLAVARQQQYLRHSEIPSHFEAENSYRKILFSHWAPLLGSKRGVTVNQRHFLLSSFFFISAKDTMAVEFHNSFIIAKPFLPLATDPMNRTYIPTCLAFCCAEEGIASLAPLWRVCWAALLRHCLPPDDFPLSSPGVASSCLMCCDTMVQSCFSALPLGVGEDDTATRNKFDL